MNSLLEQLIHHSPWHDESNPIWPATSFTLRRNLRHHLFPHKLAPAQKEHLSNLLKEKILEIEKGAFVDFTKLSAIEREFLYEHFFSPGGFGQPEAGAGAVLNERYNFYAQLNVEDHLSLHYIDTAGKWNETWEGLLAIERALARDVEYAYSSRFGYLTSRAQFCGTGLKLQAYLHVPALIHLGQLSTAFIEEVDKEVLTRNLGDEAEAHLGDIVALTNKFAIGIAEDQILRHVFGSANRLMNAEKTARLHLQESRQSDLIDKMSRTVGLLKHSTQLDTVEALGALSILKLGVNIGWVAGVTDKQLNELMFTCRRGHLLAGEGELPPPEVVLKKRAEMLHNAVQNAELTV